MVVNSSFTYDCDRKDINMACFFNYANNTVFYHVIHQIYITVIIIFIIKKMVHII